MKIHEYQGKELLKKFGVVVPRGVFCPSVDHHGGATRFVDGHDLTILQLGRVSAFAGGLGLDG
jgi:succinyl-CoA synthetase beta subunit